MSRNQRHGGALAGIMLAMLIVGLVGFAALVSTGLYVADHVRVRGRGAWDRASLEPRHLGVPIYPGAVRQHDSRKLGSFHFDFGDWHKDFAISAAAYRTSDPIDRVTEYYRGELPHWMISQKENGCMQLSLTKGGYKRMVAIYEDNGETGIALASMGEPASN